LAELIKRTASSKVPIAQPVVQACVTSRP
jgi:hypothetical protein